jgi:hypothetical protein
MNEHQIIEEQQRILKFVEREFSIQSLDDMASMFFRIAKSVGHPLKNIDLTLTKSWGEQFKENKAYVDKLREDGKSK